jgi:carotenoid cleavage dioxygenase-like enzyme
MSIPDLNNGALAPVADEHTGKPRVISGVIPPELNGSLVRNGPNPLSGQFSGQDVLNWWP